MRSSRPEALLAEWQALGLPFAARPRLLRALPGGQTNQSWLVEADGARWVLRRDAANAAALGIDRARERRIHARAAAAGLAPAIRHADPAHGLLISAYVDGRHAAPASLSASERTQLFALLRGVHALALADETPRDYRAYCAAYRPGRALDPVLAALIERIAARAAVACTHHDVVPGNVLFTGRSAMLIDWEYAARGWPLLDWAALAAEWGLPAADVAAAAGLAPGELADGRALYAAICALWSEVATAG
ncbi:MAG: phosphotransferase [Gammaproteobacteria bacterium]|nr:phosphotransferase [Gammaproteobacteria bacterium]